MLVSSNVTMQFGSKPLFENISVKFGGGNRYGLIPRFYVSTSKSIIKALINMHSFEIQLSPIG